MRISYVELPTELANLHEGPDTAVLNFVGQWGFLGHGWLLRQYSDKKPGFPPSHPGVAGEFKEPVPWIRAHARNVWYLIRIFIEFSNVSEEASGYQGATDLVRALASRGREPGEDWEIQFAAVLKDDARRTLPEGSQFGFVPGTVAYVRDLLRGVVMMMIGANLQGPHVSLRGNPAGGLTIGYRFQSLLEGIYWQLANASTGSVKFVQCRQCGRLSVKNHPRQRFCAPEPGKKESRCAVDYNTGRIRDQRRRAKASK